MEVCAVTSRQGKGREAVPNRRQPGSCRSMPELRPVETTRYSTARPVFMPLVSDFPPPVPYLSLVTCHVKGKQRYFLSAPRFHSARSKFRRGARIRRIPFMFAPADPCRTRPSRTLFYFASPAFISGKAVPPFLPSYLPACSGFLSAIAVRFSSCKGRLPRLIRRLEVHFLQILPSTKSNWQEKPSHEALPAAMYRIYKIPERFRQRKEPKEGKK